MSTLNDNQPGVKLDPDPLTSTPRYTQAPLAELFAELAELGLPQPNELSPDELGLYRYTPTGDADLLVACFKGKIIFGGRGRARRWFVRKDDGGWREITSSLMLHVAKAVVRMRPANNPIAWYNVDSPRHFEAMLKMAKNRLADSRPEVGRDALGTLAADFVRLRSVADEDCVTLSARLKSAFLDHLQKVRALPEEDLWSPAQLDFWEAAQARLWRALSTDLKAKPRRNSTRKGERAWRGIRLRRLRVTTEPRIDYVYAD